MVAIFLWHVATRAIYEQKEEYMRIASSYIPLFGIFYVEYTMIRNTLWKRVFVIELPEGNKIIVYITIYILSYMCLSLAKPIKLKLGIFKKSIMYNEIRYIYDTF